MSIYSVINPQSGKLIYCIDAETQPLNSVIGKPTDELIQTNEVFWNFETLSFYGVPLENSLTHEQLTLIKLNNDIGIGESVIKEYLLDNMLIDGLFSVEETLAMAQTFAPIRLLLEVGSLRVASELIQAIEPNPIFTQERKDKYILMLSL